MNLSLSAVTQAVVFAAIILLVSKLVRDKVSLFKSIFLPSSILAGFFALLLGPQFLGRFTSHIYGSESLLAHGLFSSKVLDVWALLPGMLINVVFAGLFLGRKFPSIRDIWRMAGPQAAFGQTLAWGQYVLGLVLALTVLVPFFNVDPKAAALIEIGFQGGHGTAAGLGEVFRELNFSEGEDIAMGLATVGVVMGVLLGVFFINIANRSKNIPIQIKKQDSKSPDLGDDNDSSQGDHLRSPTDPLSIQAGLIALSIALGWLLQQGLILLEKSTWGAQEGLQLLEHMPLFPLAMIGGVLVQIVLKAGGMEKVANRALVNRLSGIALDFIILTALATLSIEVLGNHLPTLLILGIAGISWNVFAFWFLAPKMLPRHWFERGIGDFGQSMGMTVTGLLMMKIADPHNKSNAVESFGYKQLLFEPVVGGGLFTAMSMPLIHAIGPLAVLGITSVLFILWLCLGVFYLGKKEG